MFVNLKEKENLLPILDERIEDSDQKELISKNLEYFLPRSIEYINFIEINEDETVSMDLVIKDKKRLFIELFSFKISPEELSFINLYRELSPNKKVSRYYIEFIAQDYSYEIFRTKYFSD